MNTQAVLIDARASNGVETALGMPQGPNSGLPLRLPKVTSEVLRAVESDNRSGREADELGDRALDEGFPSGMHDLQPRTTV